MTKVKKYIGVYYRKNNQNDLVYYFTYKDNGKVVFQRVGLKS